MNTIQKLICNECNHNKHCNKNMDYQCKEIYLHIINYLKRM